MKRIAILLAVLLLLTACGKTSAPPVWTSDTPPSGASPTSTPPTPETINLDQYDDYFLYQVADRKFTVDEAGNLYFYEIKTDENHIVLEHVISVYDLNGVKTEEYPIDIVTMKILNIIGNPCIGDGKIYFLADSQTDYPIWSFYSLDLKTKEFIKLAPMKKQYPDTFNNPMAMIKIAYLNGSLYILTIDPDYADAEPEFWDGDSFEQIAYDYYGTVLTQFDIATGAIEIVFDDVPHNFTVTPDRKIMLFAHDTIGGFYFQQLDPSAGFTLGEKMYRSIYQMGDFASDGKGVMYTEQRSFSYWNYTDDISGVIADTEGTGPSGDRIVYSNGFTFILRSVTKTEGRFNPETGFIDGGSRKTILERYKNSAYIKDNPAVKIISPGAGIVSRLFPDGYYSEGYNVSYNELSYDEFALTVLSRDKMYDVCLLNASDDFSANIKSKGSFYPLNDVPGVQEYINACFPYIQEAATDQNGNIWMIPICVDVPGIIYIDDNCREAGIDFPGATSVREVMDTVRKAANADPENQHYRFDSSNLIQVAITQYLRDNTTLDTPEFRQLATGLKAFWDERQHWGSNGLPEMSGSGFWFDYLFNPTLKSLVAPDSTISIAPLTGSDGSPNPVKFFAFVCVNPDSDNLDVTLEYISSLSQYMLTRPDSLMLKDFYTAFPDTEYVRQLYAMYENAAIRFNISDEIVADDFDRYLAGEIPLDTLITEADRKLRMYLNE